MPRDSDSPVATTGVISHIQRFSIHDGPGIRTTVFLKGCTLSCPWCHNPENRTRDIFTFTTRTRCMECGTCVSVCTEYAGEPSTFPPGTCSLCGTCIRACPTGARDISGFRTTPDNLLSAVSRDTPFHEQSGGGITFSGGEPMESLEFLHSSLCLCKEQGLHTAVDTSGYCSTEAVETIIPHVDLFLYDLKLMDDMEHRHWTGVSVHPVIDNLRYLADQTASIRLRIPLIPDVTMTESNIHAMGRFISSLPVELHVELLPYHRLGEDKSQRMGLPRQRVFRQPDTADIRDAIDTLRSFNIPATADSLS